MPTTTPSYPLDITGLAVTNLITNEQHSLNESVFKNYNYIVPNSSPFFLSNLVLTCTTNGVTRTLVLNQDYLPAMMYQSATNSIGISVYGGLVLLGQYNNTDIFKLTYQTLGGTWVANRTMILQAIIDSTFNPLLISFDQITNVTQTFPPTAHTIDLKNTLGMDGLISAINILTNALIAKGNNPIQITTNLSAVTTAVTNANAATASVNTALTTFTNTINKISTDAANAVASANTSLVLSNTISNQALNVFNQYAATQTTLNALNGTLASAMIQNGVYATEALGRAAVADGQYFKVVGSGDVAAYEYKRVNAATISTLVASYPSASNLTRIGSSALRLPKQHSIIKGGDLLDDGGLYFHNFAWTNHTSPLVVSTEPILANSKAITDNLGINNFINSFNSLYTNGGNVMCEGENLSYDVMSALNTHNFLVSFLMYDPAGVPDYDPAYHGTFLFYGYTRTDPITKITTAGRQYGYTENTRGSRRLSPNLVLVWATFNPITDITLKVNSTIAGSVVMLNFVFPNTAHVNVAIPAVLDANGVVISPAIPVDTKYMYRSILPNIFVFPTDVTPNIDNCDYLSFTKSVIPKYDVSLLDKVFKSVELLERQNSRLYEYVNGIGFTKIGSNIIPGEYWEANQPLINLMYSSANYWIDVNTGINPGGPVNNYASPSTKLAPYVDANGWLTNFLPTYQVKRYVMIHKSGIKVRPGTYYVTWSGPATVTVLQAAPGVNANPRSISANKYAIDVLAIPDTAVAPTPIVIVVTNNTASPITVNDIKVYHMDDEADLLAGEYIQRDWLNAHKGLNVMRFMDTISTNNSNIVNFSDFNRLPNPATNDPGSCSFTQPLITPGIDISPAYEQFTNYPPVLLAKMAKKIGADIWLNIPMKATPACVLAMANVLYAEYPTCNIYIEYSNENWNWSFWQYAYIRQFVAPKLGLSTLSNPLDPWSVPIYPSTGLITTAADIQRATIGVAAALMAAQAWAIFDTVYGRSRVKHVFAWQLGSQDDLSIIATYSYTNPATGVTTLLKDLIDLYAIAPYYGITAGFGLNTNVSEKYVKENELYKDPTGLLPFNMTFYRDGIASNMAVTRKYLNDARIVINSINPNIGLTMYEGGYGMQSTFSAENWFTVDKVNNKLVCLGTAIATDYKATSSATIIWAGSPAPVPAGGIGTVINSFDQWAHNVGTLTWNGSMWVNATPNINVTYTSGEQIILAYVTPGTELFADPNSINGVPWYIKKIDSTSIQIFKTLADYNANIPVLLTGNAASYNLGNYSRTLEYGKANQAYLRSNQGALDNETYVNLLRDMKVETYNQYFLLGGWTLGTMCFNWGIKSYTGDITPRSIWWDKMVANSTPGKGLPPYIPTV